MTAQGLANLTKLHWRQASDYHVESACGRFSISKAFVGERVNYTLWLRRTNDTGPKRISDHQTYEAAKAAAEAWR